MSTFNVHLEAFTGATVTVEAANAEAAIKKAHEEGEHIGLCAQCSGWGKKWGKDEGDEWVVLEVTDAEGETVWSPKDEQ